MPAIEVEYHETDCGSNCTPDGCPGHDTDIPVSFCFKGVWFEVAGYRMGEFPWDDPHGVKDREAYKAVFDEMIARLADGSEEVSF